MRRNKIKKKEKEISTLLKEEIHIGFHDNYARGPSRGSRIVDSRW